MDNRHRQLIRDWLEIQHYWGNLKVRRLAAAAALRASAILDDVVGKSMQRSLCNCRRFSDGAVNICAAYFFTYRNKVRQRVF
jgi:hypothetical protein